MGLSLAQFWRAFGISGGGWTPKTHPPPLGTPLYTKYRNDTVNSVSTQSDINRVSHWYSYFSWWWAHGCPKHVENRNKHTCKICASSSFIYEGYTRLHGQQSVSRIQLTHIAELLWFFRAFTSRNYRKHFTEIRTVVWDQPRVVQHIEILSFWCRIHLWFRYVGGFVRKVDDVTAHLAAQPSRLRAHYLNITTTRWRLCVTMETLWQQQYGGS